MLLSRLFVPRVQMLKKIILKINDMVSFLELELERVCCLRGVRVDELRATNSPTRTPYDPSA